MPSLAPNVPLMRRSVSHVPALSAAHLSRQRLTDLLFIGSARLRLLCAPAGFGKTMLLSECLGQLQRSQRMLWLSLAGQSLSLPQLVNRLKEALGDATKRVVDAQGLLDFLCASSAPLWVVLDDFPVDVPAEVNAWIDGLLGMPQSNVQLVVSSRQRPAWNLPRLLLEEQLIELDAGQLSFTRDELELFVSLLHPQVSSAMREDLWQQTQGWCAGIRLILFGQIKTSKAGNSSAPWLLDYLKHELLSRLNEKERDILRSLAYLPKVSVELCAQLWEEQDGGQVFRRLLHGQSFFHALDAHGTWYRMLPAVARALQGQLGAAELKSLRLRSCRILWACGHVNDAIEQAMSAEQPEVAANYMNGLALDWLFTERHLRALLGWRERLPSHLLESTPSLVFLYARGLLTSWRLEESQACLARISNFLPQPDPLRNRRLIANWQTLYGALQAMSGDAQAARLHCREALQVLPDRDWRSSILCYSILARVAMADGAADESWKLLDESVELARRHACLASEVLGSTDRVRLLILRGDLVRGEALLLESLALLDRPSSPHSLLVGRLLLLHGEVQLLRGNLDDADNMARAGLQHAEDSRDPFILNAHLLLSEVASCRGEYDQALQWLHEAERHMHYGKVFAEGYRLPLDLQIARIHARRGNWSLVLSVTRLIERALQEQGATLPPLHAPSMPQRNQLLLSLAEYESGQPTEAEKRLQALLVRCADLQFGVLKNETQLALARIACELGRPNAVALETAVRQQAVQIGLYSLLHRWSDAAAKSLLEVPQANEPQVELTQREMSVLRLLAGGLSNQEIGNVLFISLNTVKTHAKKINAKLGVKRRTQAIMRAKAMGVLT